MTLIILVWRREWDLNPRGACTPKAFQEPRIRPLCHPSRCWRRILVLQMAPELLEPDVGCLPGVACGLPPLLAVVARGRV